MNKEYIAISSLIVIIVLIGSVWAITSLSNAKTWTKLYSWNTMINNVYVDTNCNFTSNQFKITGEQWRISWTTGGEMPVGSHFDIKIYDDNVGSSMVQEIITSSNENDTTWTNGGTSSLNIQGNVHLQVFIEGGLPDWTFKIEEYK